MLAAWRGGLERGRKVDGFTPTQALLLYPCIKMTNDNYLCLVESNKRQIKELKKTQPKN